MYLFENQALFMIVIRANSKIAVNNLLFINKLLTVDQINKKILLKKCLVSLKIVSNLKKWLSNA